MDLTAGNIIVLALQEGDIAVLRSGGPEMTVTNIWSFDPFLPIDTVTCMWFSGKKKRVHSANFPIASLIVTGRTAQ